MSRRERRLDKTKNTKLKIKSIIRAFIILFILSAIFYMIYGWYKESKIKIVKNIDTKLTRIEAEENVIKIITEENEENKNYEKDIEKHKKSNLEEPVPEKYLGYKVDAKLEIPKININSNVLKEYTKEGLEVCISKFWGANPNEIGNYCIAGHNYRNKKFFSKVPTLENGDIIEITDTKGRTVKYTVYNKYTVTDDDMSPVSQLTNGRKDITLITCTDDSKERVIVKATEVL